MLCEPTRLHGVFIPLLPQMKARCFIQGYYKGIGCNTHERQYVMEIKYEAIADNVKNY